MKEGNRGKWSKRKSVENRLRDWWGMATGQFASTAGMAAIFCSVDVQTEAQINRLADQLRDRALRFPVAFAVLAALLRDGGRISPQSGLVVAIEKGKPVLAVPHEGIGGSVAFVPLGDMMPALRKVASKSGEIAGEGLSDDALLIDWMRNLAWRGLQPWCQEESRDIADVALRVLRKEQPEPKLNAQGHEIVTQPDKAAD